MSHKKLYANNNREVKFVIINVTLKYMEEGGGA